MSIQTDQATVDRWLAAGQWVEFAEGEPIIDHRPGCDRHCRDEAHCLVEWDGTSPPSGWEAAQERIAVLVRTCDWWNEEHRRCPGCEQHDMECGQPAAWATVEWGPLPVESLMTNDNSPYPRVFADPTGIDHVIEGGIIERHIDREALPNIPGNLVGQWARGGRIEATP